LVQCADRLGGGFEIARAGGILRLTRKFVERGRPHITGGAFQRVGLTPYGIGVFGLEGFLHQLDLFRRIRDEHVQHHGDCLFIILELLG